MTKLFLLIQLIIYIFGMPLIGWWYILIPLICDCLNALIDKNLN